MGDMSATMRQEHRDQAFTDWGEPITYTQKSTTTDKQTGAKTSTDTNTTIDLAIPGYVSQSVVANSGGKYRIGDRVFRIRDGDMAEQPPKTTSVITYGGTDYQIVGHDPTG